jgi:hypothetical protein
MPEDYWAWQAYIFFFFIFIEDIFRTYISAEVFVHPILTLDSDKCD